MSLLIDAAERKALFKDKSNYFNIPCYNKEEYTSIQDYGSTNSVLAFDNQTVMSLLTTLHDAFLAVPITFSRSTSPAWDSNTPNTLDMCCKVSAAELFEQIQFTLAGGATIHQEQQSLPLINTFRKLMRYNNNGLVQKAEEFQYHHNEFPNLLSGKVAVDVSNLTQTNLYKQTIAPTTVTSITSNVVTVSGITLSSAYLNTPVIFTPHPTDVQAASLPTELIPGQIYYIQSVPSSTTFTLSNSPNGAVITTSGAIAGVVRVASIALPNPLYNEGLVKKIELRKMHTNINGLINNAANIPSPASDTNSFTVTFYVPLAEIHEVFAQWITPYTNIRWQLKLTFANAFSGLNTSGIFNPFIFPAGLEPDSVVPVLGKCQLYVKNIVLNKNDATMYDQMIKQGISKQIFFTETMYIKIPNLQNNSGTNSLPGNLIIPSISHVQRVILFGVPAGLLVSRNKPFIPSIELTNCTLRINNIKERTFDAVTRRDFWQIFKEHIHGSGDSDVANSLVNWQTYNQGHCFWYVFDFERTGIRPEPHIPIQLSVDITRAETSAADFYCLIEQQTYIDLDYSTQKVSVEKKYLTPPTMPFNSSAAAA